MTTAISPSRVASTYGALAIFQNLAPGGFALAQRLAIIAYGNTATTFSLTKAQMFSGQQAGETYGFGSPIHTIVKQLLPSSGDGVGDVPVTIYPLADGTTASTIVVTPAGTPTSAGTYFVRVNNIDSASFQLAASATVAQATAAIDAAITATLDQPVTSVSTALIVTATAKWQGATGEDLVLSIEGPSLGMTFGIAPGVTGAGNAPIDATLLAQFGEIHETMIIQANGDETASLDALSAFGEGRWAAELSKPLVSFYASVETAVATAIVVPDARTTDRVNVQLSAPGSLDQPWAVSARMVARIVKVANGASPASDYVRQEATGLTPGPDSTQWTSAERDTAVKAGTSTSEVRGGLVTVSDTVTMFHPVGDPTPAYRYVNDIVKLQQILNDTRIVFDSAVWIGAPLIPDGQATSNRSAKKPKMATAEISRLIDSWADRALISDPDAAKASIVTAIDGGNPRRLNVAFTVQLSGNANIISEDLNFGFFFGGA